MLECESDEESDREEKKCRQPDVSFSDVEPGTQESDMHDGMSQGSPGDLKWFRM